MWAELKAQDLCWDVKVTFANPAGFFHATAKRNNLSVGGGDLLEPDWLQSKHKSTFIITQIAVRLSLCMCVPHHHRLFFKSTPNEKLLDKVVKTLRDELFPDLFYDVREHFSFQLININTAREGELFLALYKSWVLCLQLLDFPTKHSFFSSLAHLLFPFALLSRSLRVPIRHLSQRQAQHLNSLLNGLENEIFPL